MAELPSRSYVVCRGPIKVSRRRRYCTRTCRALRAGQRAAALWLVDVFPGSGAVTEAWRAFQAQPRLAYTVAIVPGP